MKGDIYRSHGVGILFKTAVIRVRWDRVQKKKTTDGLNTICFKLKTVNETNETYNDFHTKEGINNGSKFDKKVIKL